MFACSRHTPEWLNMLYFSASLLSIRSIFEEIEIQKISKNMKKRKWHTLCVYRRLWNFSISTTFPNVCIICLDNLNSLEKKSHLKTYKLLFQTSITWKQNSNTDDRIQALAVGWLTTQDSRKMTICLGKKWGWL